MFLNNLLFAGVVGGFYFNKKGRGTRKFGNTYKNRYKRLMIHGYKTRYILMMK